jgi:hypothetical protein
MASPLFGSHTDAGDPVAAFDRAGNLYAGGIAFNRVRPANGDVWVAKYLTTPHPSGYPYDYSHTRIVGQGTPSAVQGGIFQDKIMLEVDRTGGSHDGNVYVCWTRFVANGQNRIYFSRSTDGGNSFSRPIAISGGGNIRTQGCDIAIEHDGDVYVSYRTFATPSMRTATLAFAASSPTTPSTATATAATAPSTAPPTSCSPASRWRHGSPPTSQAAWLACTWPTWKSGQTASWPAPAPTPRPGPAWSASRWSI